MNAELHLTNTLSRKKEIFRSGEEGKVRLFTCGPSTYRRAHLGNYRTFLYEDVLQRYLEYLGYDVERMMNLTDVEDKAIAEARRQGISLKELTGTVEDQFFKESALLAIRIPEHTVRATTSVDQAARLIKLLMKKGYAYRHGEDVFFDPLKFEGFGKLYGLDMSRWPKKKRRFRKDTYPGQRWNLGDFILWHGGDAGGIHWDTEIGRGRPAWNIQDAAMITKNFGFKVDVACGGVDNLYRHHDYTIAIIEAASGGTFSTYWLHGEHVLVSGAKMSKSRGNIVYLENLMEQGYTPEFVRFFLVYGHYRKPLDLTDEGLERIAGRFGLLKELIRQLTSLNSAEGKESRQAAGIIADVEGGFRERMNDDLDVKGAIDGIQGKLRALMSMKMKGEFSDDHAVKLGRILSRIDTVFQVFGDPSVPS